MTVLALLLGLVAFVAVLHVLRAQQLAGNAVRTAQSAIGTIADPELGDDEKEARVRRASLSLLGSFAAIAGTGIAACGAAALMVWGGAALDLYDLGAAMDTALGWPFILGSCVVAVALWLVLSRRTRAAETGDREEVPYDPLDKALHNYAFASPDRQRRLGEVETRLYRRRIDTDAAARPVFITSLPRAGTTILLETLSGAPDFASATYRHMPFTLAPLLWGGFSRVFRKSGTRAERAHGDGIDVGIDSPEAFEEMLWMTFWPGHYAGCTIQPWSADERDEAFESFFRTHMAKIVASRPGATRYVSKNNANIARLPLLHTLFPDATLLIPVRDPWSQTESLLRQHRRFADLHAREPFARQYMQGIGHFEFGEALKPIAFPGGPHDQSGANTPEFWLRYWVDAYEHVLATAPPNAVFVDHDALCRAPDRHLALLADKLGMDDSRPLTGMAGTLRAPRPVPEPSDVPATLMTRADDVYAELRRRAIGHTPVLKDATAS